MSTPYANIINRRISINPSKVATICHAITHLGASLIVLSGSRLYPLLLLVLPWIFLSYRRITRLMITHLQPCADFSYRLYTQTGKSHRVNLQASSCITAHMSLLVFKSDFGKTYKLCLFRDSLQASDFRRLKTHISLSAHKVLPQMTDNIAEGVKIH